MRKKILFVTHALESLYGAATSLRLLLSQYADEVDADVLLPRSLRHPRDLSRTAAFYGFRKAYELSLPVDLALVGVKRGFKDQIYGALHHINWQRDRCLYHKLLQRNRYDVIHLNSVTLHRLTRPGLPFISHIREVITKPSSPALANLQEGLGLIFIDEATRKPFSDRGNNIPSTVLNNPVDMSDINDFENSFSHPLLRSDTTLFSIVGQIYESKGVEFVIRAYRKGAAPNTMLIIAGEGPATYVERCREAAGGDPRIVFWGAEKEIKRIYASTDYVVRGETRHCVGRTIYEGLYAGCNVIMPGLGEPIFLFEVDKFLPRVALYKARDLESLADTFATFSGRKVNNRVGQSNIGAYVRTFDAFLDRCLTAKNAALLAPFLAR
jgi:glycosyltransferase involved in cell wall biosynthesis